MDTQEQHDRGLALRTELFGRDAVEKRMAAFRKREDEILATDVIGDILDADEIG